MPAHHVLVVDDDPQIRAVTGRICEKLGIAHTAATDGQKALDCLNRHIYDAVLLDVNMPRLDGFGVLEALRARQSVPMPPIIMVTSEDDSVGRARATALGAIDFVEKPFNFDELMRRLKRVLTISDMEAQLRAAEGALQALRAADARTGLGSYAALQHSLNQAYSDAVRQNVPLTCIILADESMHPKHSVDLLNAATERLARLAAAVTLRLNATDRVFRVDLAELVVLLPYAGREHAREAVRTIAELVDEFHIPQFCVGIATMPHPDITHASTLYRAANNALAQARSRGVPNSVVYFERA